MPLGLLPGRQYQRSWEGPPCALEFSSCTQNMSCFQQGFQASTVHRTQGTAVLSASLLAVGLFVCVWTGNVRCGPEAKRQDTGVPVNSTAQEAVCCFCLSHRCFSWRGTAESKAQLFAHCKGRALLCYGAQCSGAKRAKQRTWCPCQNTAWHFSPQWKGQMARKPKGTGKGKPCEVPPVDNTYFE